MDTSFKLFATKFSEGIASFLWRQWSAVGVMGAASDSESPPGWMIDPEPLLLFTLETARRDARLFDEILDWLMAHEARINVQRLTALIEKEPALCDRALMGAVAALLAERKPRALKWRRLASRCKPGAVPHAVPLFMAGSRPVGTAGDADPLFKSYGLLRDPVTERGFTRRKLDLRPEATTFRLRALFGIDMRSDLLSYLLTHDGGHAHGLARRYGYSQKRVQDVLTDMVESGMVLDRVRGRMRVYWLDRSAWWDFLGGGRWELPVLPDWRLLLRGLTTLWQAVWAADPKTGAYVLSSHFRTAIRAARDDLLASEVQFRISEDDSWAAESYLPVFYDTVTGILNTINPTTRHPK